MCRELSASARKAFVSREEDTAGLFVCYRMTWKGDGRRIRGMMLTKGDFCDLHIPIVFSSLRVGLMNLMDTLLIT